MGLLILFVMGITYFPTPHTPITTITIALAIFIGGVVQSTHPRGASRGCGIKGMSFTTYTRQRERQTDSLTESFYRVVFAVEDYYHGLVDEILQEAQTTHHDETIPCSPSRRDGEDVRAAGESDVVSHIFHHYK